MVLLRSSALIQLSLDSELKHADKALEGSLHRLQWT